MTETIPKSRTEALTRLARDHGTDFLLDVIHESRVGISNAFMDEEAMDKVIRKALKMLAEKEPT